MAATTNRPKKRTSIMRCVVLKSLKFIAMGGTVILIGVASALTPIFANLGVGLLNLYSALTLATVQDEATSIVVLGGGLTKNSAGTISLNHFTQSRANAAIHLHNLYPLSMITSGAESPWLRDYLIEHIGTKVVIINENASMNTCENAVFTAKLLSHHELSTTVYLVTDRYHMARARRQFAKAGIHTIAAPAPLAIHPSWRNPKDNLIHTRRTIYELVALARDIITPQANCRTTDEISIEEIATPRRQPKLF
ncbi:YdcF family protein [Moraxella catarrhalis]|uniref:YdcF family protein n=1 Tax=Moraxella catarrhalis TaxID=480 RepID=UPI00128B3CD4|nr:YdcF family protein [Moraxella catarrhalis]MPW46728.1 YdcF family protein [Moraxella catarrhalis]MPW48012.1 YdcF family protein [Moraxella catarrhalis]